jgi:hypothetical protein
MKVLTLLLTCLFVFIMANVAYAEGVTMPQIPSIQVCNVAKGSGEAYVHLTRRADVTNAGDFKVAFKAKCSPPNYPIGQVELSMSLSDNSTNFMRSTTVDEITSTGRHTPVLYMKGRCMAKWSKKTVTGCQYWIQFTDNGELGHDTPDIVSFLILNGLGQRIAYATGPIVDGDILVQPTVN